MALNQQRVTRSTSCLVLGWGFRGRQIERCHFQLDPIQDGGLNMYLVMYVLLLLLIFTMLSIVLIQMGKQTMGIPLHAWTHRSDNKLYRLQTAQSPIVRPYLHDDLGMDNYPLGTNAIVAVLSYTVCLILSFFKLCVMYTPVFFDRGSTVPKVSASGIHGCRRIELRYVN